MNRLYRIGLIEREGGGTWHPYEVEFNWGIAGVLTSYDLPDLIGCIAPRKVAIADPRDHTLTSAPADLVEQEMSFPRNAYSYKAVPENLKIISSAESQGDFIDWCFK